MLLNTHFKPLLYRFKTRSGIRRLQRVARLDEHPAGPQKARLSQAAPQDLEPAQLRKY